jgi:hypothetical protein
MNSRRFALILAVFLLWPWSIYGRDDGGPQYKAPPEIVAALPKFCWWFYLDKVPNTPEYNIKDCGANSNHYCPGLVAMAQAERQTDRKLRLERLKRAKSEMEYTLRGTIDHPECSVRPPAKMHLERLKFQIEMLQLQMRKR